MFDCFKFELGCHVAYVFILVLVRNCIPIFSLGSDSVLDSELDSDCSGEVVFASGFCSEF